MSINEREARLKAIAEAIEDMILTELNKILDADNQLEALKPHLDNIYAGEDNNKQTILVSLSGSKHQNMKMKQIITVKGSSRVGKTTLADRLSKSFKTKKIGRFTAHALDYTVLTPYEVLYIQELGNMDEEYQGISMLKFLNADDEGYTVEYTVKAEGGGFTTKTKHIPPMTVIDTTTKLTLERQFEGRSWLFNCDESDEQTKKVTEWKARHKQQEIEVDLGRRLITDYELSMKVIQRYFSTFSVVKADILYPKTLSKILGYSQLRIRGDIDKVYTFVEQYAQFNKKRLIPIKNTEIYYIPPEVCIDALKLLAEPFTSMLTRIDKRSRALIEALKYCGYGNISHNFEINKVGRDDLAIKLGKSHNTIKSWLYNWCSAGVASHNSGKPIVFTLLYDPDVIKEKLDKISLKFESFDDLIIEMRKEAQEFIKTLSLKRVVGSNRDESYTPKKQKPR